MVCTSYDETHRQVLKKLASVKKGETVGIIPEKENADRLAKSLSSPNVLDYIELSDDYGIIEVPAPKAWFEKSLIELNIRAKLGVNILAVKRDGGITGSPAAEFRIGHNDVLVVLGDTAALNALQKL